MRRVALPRNGAWGSDTPKRYPASCARTPFSNGPGLARRRTHDAAGQHRRELPGAVKLKDLTARQVQKALAELSASLPTRSLRRPLLSARLTRSLAHGEQLHWQPVVDRRGRGLRSRVCFARPQPCLPAECFRQVRGPAEPPARAALRGGRRERTAPMPNERAGDPGNRGSTIADLAEAAGPGSVDGRHLLLVGAEPTSSAGTT